MLLLLSLDQLPYIKGALLYCKCLIALSSDFSVCQQKQLCRHIPSLTIDTVVSAGQLRVNY